MFDILAYSCFAAIGVIVVLAILVDHVAVKRSK